MAEGKNILHDKYHLKPKNKIRYSMLYIKVCNTFIITSHYYLTDVLFLI